jgi:hypothetical protein
VLVLLAPTIPTVATEADAQGSGGAPWWLFILVTVLVVGLGALLLLLSRRGQKAPEMPCSNCGRVLMPEWQACMFCKTPRTARPASLEFISGPLSGRTVKIDGEVTSIGSAPGSTVVLNDSGVSRKHVGIRKVSGAYELADLGSTNGVYVNGEKVAKKRLELGDVIRVGATEIVFKC